MERTSNMRPICVTLDVSKLSGWLKACAFCRVKGRGVRCRARCGRLSQREGRAMPGEVRAPGGGRA